MNDRAVDSNDIQSRIREVIGAVFDVAPLDVGPESSPESIPAWDSVNHIQLMLAIEDEFGVQFGADEFASARSVLQIEALVADRKQK